MKLFLKAIAIGAEKRQSALAELNRLIDVAESSGLVVWHDNVCFKSSFWKWGKRTGTINWGGYGSSYRPENEKYFKFQYRGDTVKDGKLVIRKGAKPLDAVKALVLPEADADGSMQKLMVDAGATVTVAGKGLKVAAILDAAKKKKINFILTADSVPKGLAEVLDKAAEAKTHIFTLPVGRLRPLLEKPVRTGVKRARKPLAFEDKDTARSFSKLKSLLSSQKLDEIEHAITLLPGIPGACDKLLEGITLKKGVNTWINDEETWRSRHGTGRPEVWAGKFDYSNQRDNVLPAKITLEGDNLLVDEIPKNDLFTGSDLRRYALMRVIAAAPDDCAAAKSIRDGLLGLIWNYSGSSSFKPILFPPLGVFKTLKHLYLDLRCGQPANTADFPDSLRTLVVDNYRDSLDWLPENAGVAKVTIAGRAEGPEGVKHLKGLKELQIGELESDLPMLEKLMVYPCLKVRDLQVRMSDDDSDSGDDCQPVAHQRTAGKSKSSAASKVNKGTPLPAKEISKIKKLLYEDKPASALQGITLLTGASIATFDLLFGKADFSKRDAFGKERVSSDDVHFFKSLKKTVKSPHGYGTTTNQLTEALKITLISIAPEGCSVADAVRDETKYLRLPDNPPIPVDVSGYEMTEEINFSVDLDKPDCSHIAGLEKLKSLKKATINIPYTGKEKLPTKLNLSLPPSMEALEVKVGTGYSRSDQKGLPTLDFLPTITNLKELHVVSVKSLSSLARFVPSSITRLKAEYVQDHDFSALPFKDTIVSLSGDFPNLTSLKGLENCRGLKTLSLSSESLSDVDALKTLTGLRELEFGAYANEEDTPESLPLSPLKNHVSLASVSYGAHPPSDFVVIREFKSKPRLKLRNVVVRRK